MNKISREDFVEFIKNSRDSNENLSMSTKYYLDKFDKGFADDLRPSWNWPAFFSPFLWLVYRRMYLIALGILILSFSISFSIQNFEINESAKALFMVIQFGTNLCFGLFGNGIYLRHVNHAIHSNSKANGVDNLSVIIIIIAISSYAIYEIYSDNDNYLKESQNQENQSVINAGKS